MLGTRAAGSVATGRPVRCHATSYFCTRFISCESPLDLTKLAILEGDPGMGKPLLALDLCARVTRGGLFPDGNDVTAPGKRPVGGRFFAFARFEKRVGDSKAARRARRPAQIDCIAYLCQRCRATTPHRQQLANQLASPPRCATIAPVKPVGGVFVALIAPPARIMLFLGFIPFVGFVAVAGQPPEPRLLIAIAAAALRPQR